MTTEMTSAVSWKPKKCHEGETVWWNPQTASWHQRALVTAFLKKEY